MITENLSTLKIHKLTQEQYDRELAAGNIDANALYLTPEEEMQEKHIAKPISLSVSNWSNLSQTINVSGVTTDNTIIATPAPISRSAYVESDVYCDSQANGSLTFKCSTVPTANLTINVLILN